MPRAEARYDITAKDKTDKAIASARRGFVSLRKTVNTSGKAIAGIGSVATVALGAVVKSSLAANDALAKTSSKLGIAQDRLQGLRLAASQTAGVTNKTLDLALQRMTRRVSEAAQGTGEAKKAIAELGLDAQKLAQSTPDQVFAKVSAAMQGVNSQGDRLRLAFKLFDSEGAALVNTLSAGVPVLEQYHEEAKALGIALNRVETAKIEAANDAMEKASLAAQGLGNKLTIALAPILEELADRFTNLVKGQKDFDDKVRTAMEFGVRAVGLFADAWRSIQVGIKGVQVIIAGVKAAMIGLGNVIAKVGTGLIQNLLTPFKKLLTALAPFSKKARAALESLQGFEIRLFEPGTFEAAVKGIELAKAELKALALETIPSEALKKQLNDILDNAQARAEAIAAKASESSGPEKRSFDRAAVLKNTFDQLDKLREKDRKASEAANDAKARNFDSTLSTITSLTDRESKKQNALWKVAAVTQATIDGVAAVQKALASGFYPLNIAMAAIVGGLAAANVSKIAGARRLGGFVTGGSNYLVGEDGPEVLQMPGTGRIIPNNQLGGAANEPNDVAVHFHIDTLDARSFDQMLAERKTTVRGIIREAFFQNGQRVAI